MPSFNCSEKYHKVSILEYLKSKEITKFRKSIIEYDIKFVYTDGKVFFDKKYDNNNFIARDFRLLINNFLSNNK
jgi:hypothetical protein